MSVACLYDFLLYLYQFVVYLLQINRLFFLCKTDVSGNIEVIVILLYLLQRHLARIARYFPAILIGVYNIIHIFIAKIVLPFPFFVMLI